MDLLTGATGNLIPKLVQLLENEYKLQTGIKKKVKSLTRELQSIHAFLRKVSDVPWYQLDELVKLWANDAREVSYDMEDALDTFLMHIDGGEPNDPTRLKRALKKMTNVFSRTKARHDFGCTIQEIESRVQEVADRHDRYRIDDIVVNHATTTWSTDPRLHAMYVEVANLVGIDRPKDELISKLSAQGGDMGREKKIVSIFGIGGLGKTTLAKELYKKLHNDFECWAFVPVGRNPNQVRLLMDILYELDKKRFADIHTKNKHERQLIDDIREFLVDKRYFIVIDDIWETTSWKQTIELALLENNCGSRIIITTRNSEVATKIGDEAYKMPSLSTGNSRKLFYTRIFGAEEKWPDNEPDEIANKILKKCDGVPLAIITMASLLVKKPREKWSQVFNSVGFGHKDVEEVNVTMKILSFSYYDMPAYLRTCLLYLSVFPEDYEIGKESLIWKWIAEGFIHREPGIRLFELGERYFNELVNRSMVQAIESSWDGRVHECRVHDMVLDLIRVISSEENFVTILDHDEGTVSPPLRTARRLAFHKSTRDHTADDNMVDVPQVRSFTAIKCAFGNRVAHLSNFELLRVLNLEACTNVRPSYLVHLGNLHHLRYLGFESTQISQLPDEIGVLKLLQILNLHNTGINELPPSISQLSQLVCLKADVHLILAANWIRKLTSLEDLHLISDVDQEEHDSRVFLNHLGSLRELRVLRCSYIKLNKGMERDLVLSLRNLHKLQHLEFHSGLDVCNSMWGEVDLVLPQQLRILRMGDFKFSYLPSCISAACLPNLTHLSLDVDVIDEKGMEFLGRLPELFYLWLRTESTVTISNINASNNGYFQKLRYCVMPDSMIQFQYKEEDWSISFHIWNGIDVMPFSSRKNDCSLAPCVVMPNLEVLQCQIYVRALKDGKGETGNFGLEYLASLREVVLEVKSEGASSAERYEATGQLVKATEVHPNRPSLCWILYGRKKDRIISAAQGQQPEGDISAEEECRKQQEGQPMVDEGVTNSSTVNS